jgi:hypothetical protein
LSDSILAQGFIDQMMAIARQNLERDGRLTTVIFLRFEDRVIHVVNVDLPETADERYTAIRRLGRQLRCHGQLQEAVMLMDSWYVAGEDMAEGLPTLPSRHHDRQQAILAVGRNADNSRMSLVVQPYRTDEPKGWIWPKPVITYYDQPADDTNRAEGLLDDLFIPQGTH